MKQKEQHQPFTHQSITKNQRNSIYKNNLEEMFFFKIKFRKTAMWYEAGPHLTWLLFYFVKVLTGFFLLLLNPYEAVRNQHLEVLPLLPGFHSHLS